MAAGLAIFAMTGIARAQTLPPVADDSILAKIARATKFRHDPVTPKDFVVQSRASAPRTNFMPVGVTPPDHAIAVKSVANVRGTEASLIALRSGHDRLAGRKQGKRLKKVSTPAGPPKPSKPARLPVNILIPPD